MSMYQAAGSCSLFGCVLYMVDRHCIKIAAVPGKEGCCVETTMLTLHHTHLSSMSLYHPNTAVKQPCAGSRGSTASCMYCSQFRSSLGALRRLRQRGFFWFLFFWLVSGLNPATLRFRFRSQISDPLSPRARRFVAAAPVHRI